MQKVASSTTRLLRRLYKAKNVWRPKYLKYKIRKALENKGTKIFKLRSSIAFSLFYALSYFMTGKSVCVFVFPSTLKRAVGLSRKRKNRWYATRDETFFYRYLNKLAKKWTLINKVMITKTLKKEIEKWEFTNNTFLKRKVNDRIAFEVINLKSYERDIDQLLKDEKFRKEALMATAFLLKFSAPFLDLLADKKFLKEVAFVLRNVAKIVGERECSQLKSEQEREACKKHVEKILEMAKKFERFPAEKIKEKLPTIKRGFYRAAERLLREANSIT